MNMLGKSATSTASTTTASPFMPQRPGGARR
jgi:hypothetical protein